jgi:adenine-specific DNA-methyltransferase
VHFNIAGLTDSHNATGALIFNCWVPPPRQVNDMVGVGNLLNSVDGGRRQCIIVTNNEVAASEAQTLISQGHQPGNDRWERHGICRSVTWPRSKYTILGHREGTPLIGDYYTGRTVERSKRRNFKHLSFVSPTDYEVPEGLAPDKRAKAVKLIIERQRSLVSLIDGLPQDAVTEECKFIVHEDYTVSVLFRPEATEAWLAALDEQNHVTDFFIVADTDKQFKAIRAQVDELLGDLTVKEEEMFPMSKGFAANLAYFKLDFLDKDRVELGAAFREILPLFWLKAGAIGPMPELPAGPLPSWFAPKDSNFAVLLIESRMRGFISAIKHRTSMSHIFIVTNADEAFRAMAGEVGVMMSGANPNVKLVHLYRDYLMNFIINTRNDEASALDGAMS